VEYFFEEGRVGRGREVGETGGKFVYNCRKKICKFKSHVAATVKGLRKKYYPKRSGGVEIFFSKTRRA
jgi:hypothetical protein